MVRYDIVNSLILTTVKSRAMNGLLQKLTAHACGKDDDHNKQRHEHATKIWARKAARIWVHKQGYARSPIMLGLIGLSCLCKTDHNSELYWSALAWKLSPHAASGRIYLYVGL
jgi:hypothetical protein